MVGALCRGWSSGLVSLATALVATAGCNTRHESPATAASAHSVALPTSAVPNPAPSPQAAPSANAARAEPSPALVAKAKDLTHKFIVLDGHVDLPWRLDESRDQDGSISEDVSHRTPKGDFDWERAREGGLSAPFMSIYVPSKYENAGAKKIADRLIDMVTGFAQKWPDKFALAKSPSEVRTNFAAGKVSLAMGMENGSPIEHDLANVRHFHERGIRYITLTHSKDNHISDSSYDEKHTHKGLSDFGKQVVAEMNRLGIMVDVAHVADDTFWQVMDLSKVPVIASHSSCRHFTPGFQRNVSDDMLQALAKHKGVIQINFGSGFIDAQAQKQQDEMRKEVETILKSKGLDFGDAKAKPILAEFRASHPHRFATVEQVADHIDHVRKLVGIDHVGLGSDFDGVGDSLPSGLKDVSQYPNLVRVLLERGYSEQDIEKVCSGNVLRVWQAVEDFARTAAPPK
ncbi:MAG TPA: dipeptidase [Polyangiaceae bacterium]|nr:dipeptidase [Polyangiaceae bacterium]